MKVKNIIGLIFFLALLIPSLSFAGENERTRGVMVPIPGGDEGREAYATLIDIAHNGEGEYSELQRNILKVVLDSLYIKWRSQVEVN